MHAVNCAKRWTSNLLICSRQYRRGMTGPPIALRKYINHAQIMNTQVLSCENVNGLMMQGRGTPFRGREQESGGGYIGGYKGS